MLFVEPIMSFLPFLNSGRQALLQHWTLFHIRNVTQRYHLPYHCLWELEQPRAGRGQGVGMRNWLPAQPLELSNHRELTVSKSKKLLLGCLINKAKFIWWKVIVTKWVSLSAQTEWASQTPPDLECEHQGYDTAGWLTTCHRSRYRHLIHPVMWWKHYLRHRQWENYPGCKMNQ